MSDLPNDRQGILIAINNREKEINGTLDKEVISLISHELNVLYARLKQLNESGFRMRPSQACWDGDVSEQEWMDMNKGE